MAKKNKRTCLNCHFLCIPGWNPDRVKVFNLVSEAEREASSRGDFSWFFGPNYFLGCTHDVDKLGDPTKQMEYYDRLIAPRDNCPFYCMFKPYMGFETADALRKEEKERQDKRHNTRLTIAGWVVPNLVSYGITFVAGLIAGQLGIIDKLIEVIRKAFGP